MCGREEGGEDEVGPPPNLSLWLFSTVSRVGGISDLDVFSKSRILASEAKLHVAKY